MKDILGRQRALRALVELRKADPEPLSQAQLMDATGYEFRGLVKLVADLSAWGLVTAKDTFHGKLPVTEHRLTPAGREVADLARKIEAAAVKARDARKRGHSDS